MNKTIVVLLLLLGFLSSLNAQNGKLPPLGGIILDDSIFALAGAPRSDIVRASPPGSSRSLVKDGGIKLFDQGCENSCGSCAIAGAAMIRLKIHCAAKCSCRVSIPILSWSVLHNQLVKQYGKDRITLRNALELLRNFGIIPASLFPNTPCRHDRLPDPSTQAAASQYQAWTYEPAFSAKIFFEGTPEQKEQQFRDQLVYSTIFWIDQGMPIIAGLLVTDDFQNLRGADCYWNTPASLEGAEGHALVIVGYDDSKAEFEALNSYGPSWGCQGLVRIRYSDYIRVVKEGYVLNFDLSKSKKTTCPGKR